MQGRQKDIEVYVRERDVDRIVEWVERVVGSVSLALEDEGIRIYHSKGGSAAPGLAVTITPGIEGGPFISIMFSPNRTPWTTDADCARQLAGDLGVEVRYCRGPDTPESGVFLRIVAETEDRVDWDAEIEDRE